MRKTFIAAVVAAGALMGMATVAQAVPAVVYTGPAQGNGGYIVQMAPPAPIYEVTPSARAGYTWSPGFYEWRSDRYVWTSGRWIEAREGWAWQQARWEQRGDGSWHLIGGQWVERDRYAYGGNDEWRERRGRRFSPNGDLDGDGIRNEDDRDRDGDGVRNRDDDFPNDPTRH